jgi:hypothetical protein
MLSCLEVSWLMESCFIASWAKVDIEAINMHASAKLPKIFFIVFSFEEI